MAGGEIIKCYGGWNSGGREAGNRCGNSQLLLLTVLPQHPLTRLPSVAGFGSPSICRKSIITEDPSQIYLSAGSFQLQPQLKLITFLFKTEQPLGLHLFYFDS